jgi:hypothetical protein
MKAAKISAADTLASKNDFVSYTIWPELDAHLCKDSISGEARLRKWERKETAEPTFYQEK